LLRWRTRPLAKAAQNSLVSGQSTRTYGAFSFAPKNPEFFCMRQKRVARERVERVKQVLARDLANPPTLETIGQEVGCSPFYLSRIFSREVGLTIPQYLRNLRMERAAELLRTGRYTSQKPQRKSVILRCGYSTEATIGSQKCFAEMAQARITDFRCGFCDVVSTGAQQLGGRVPSSGFANIAE